MDIIPSGNQTWLAGTPTQLYDFPNVTLPFMDCPMIFPYLPKNFQVQKLHFFGGFRSDEKTGHQKIQKIGPVTRTSCPFASTSPRPSGHRVLSSALRFCWEKKSSFCWENVWVTWLAGRLNSHGHWLGWREEHQKLSVFPPWNLEGSCKCSLHPMLWASDLSAESWWLQATPRNYWGSLSCSEGSKTQITHDQIYVWLPKPILERLWENAPHTSQGPSEREFELLSCSERIHMNVDWRRK